MDGVAQTLEAHLPFATALGAIGRAFTSAVHHLFVEEVAAGAFEVVHYQAHFLSSSSNRRIIFPSADTKNDEPSS